MPRLIPLEINEAKHRDKIIKSKRAPARTRLLALKAMFDARYLEYASKTHSLGTLSKSKLKGKNHKYCRECYNLDRTAVAALKQAVLNARPSTRSYYCQWCLIDSWEDLDHYVPRESFPEFAVMARNLAPCCSKCNKAKLSYWPPLGVAPEVLSLYYDTLLDTSHLSATVSHLPGQASSITFIVRQDAGLTATEIATLHAHYIRLKLFPRLRDAGLQALSEFRQSLRIRRMSRADATTDLTEFLNQAE